MALQLSGRQFLHSRVKGNENTALLLRLPEEQSICPLLVPPDSRSHEFEACCYLSVQGPEFMPGVGGIFA